MSAGTVGGFAHEFFPVDAAILLPIRGGVRIQTRSDQAHGSCTRIKGQILRPRSFATQLTYFG